MSIHAGRIVHLGANAVLDRIQAAGLGDVRVPTDIVREVGTRPIIDKVPGDPEFTFTVESLDVTQELEAWLVGIKSTGSGAMAGPGDADAAATTYDMTNCQAINIVSPWKSTDGGSAGLIGAGHILPAYYPTAIRYRFGVSDHASQTVDLAGGAFYYGKYAPVEEFFTGNGATVAYPTSSAAVGGRIGGIDGTSFRRVHGVLVNGVPQAPGIDYNETGPNDATAAVATITFVTAPAAAADIRFCYFTSTAQPVPESRHASAVNKPAAVRGRHICVYLASGGARALVGGVQSATLDYILDTTVDREFCNDESLGRTVTGTDCSGDVVVRSRDINAFYALVAKVTGIPATEVIGWLNTNAIPLEIAIKSPKDPSVVLKTLYVDDAVFQIPGTQARVNSPVDFSFHWESRSGTFTPYKGAKP